MNPTGFITNRIGGSGDDDMQVSYNLQKELGSTMFLEIPCELYDTVDVSLNGLTTLPDVKFFAHTEREHGFHITNSQIRNQTPDARAYLFSGMVLNVWKKASYPADDIAFQFSRLMYSYLFNNAWLQFKMDKYSVFELPISRIACAHISDRWLDVHSGGVTGVYHYFFGKKIYLRPRMPFEFNIFASSEKHEFGDMNEFSWRFRLSLFGFDYRPPSSN